MLQKHTLGTGVSVRICRQFWDPGLEDDQQGSQAACRLALWRQLGRSFQLREVPPETHSNWKAHPVNSTPYRTPFAHAIFSRAWLKIDNQTQCEAHRVPLNMIVCRSRAPCLTCVRNGLTLLSS